VRLWDVATGEARDVPLLGHEDSVYAVAFSPSGEVLATGGSDNRVRLWRVSDGTPIGDPLQTFATVWSVQFSPDGAVLAAADSNGAVHQWNTTSREPLGEEPIQTRQGTVYAICFVRNGTGLATGGADGTIRYWDATDGSAVGRPVMAHEGALRTLACDPEGSQLASSGVDGRVRLWRVGGTAPETELLAENDEGYQEVAFSPDGSQLVFTSSAGDNQSSVTVWDVEVNSLIRTFPILLLTTDGKLSPDGARAAAGGEDGRVTVWETATGRQIAEQRVPDEGGIWQVAFSPDGSYIALGTGSGEVRLWDGSEASPVSDPLGRHGGEVSALAFNGDGTLLASGAADGTVQLWNPATRQPVGDLFVYTISLTGDPTTVRSLAFRPDGVVLAVTGLRTVGLWDIERAAWNGLPLSAHSGNIFALVYSPDGQLLASGGDDGVVRLLGSSSGETVAELPLSSTQLVQALTFSPDGSRLVAGQRAGTITAWELSRGTATALGQLDLTDKNIVSLAFAADGTTLAGLDGVGAISHWDLSVETWRENACSVANRNLTWEEWATYIGDPDSSTLPYQAICPKLPLPVETNEATPVGIDVTVGGAAPATPAALGETV